MAVAKGFIREKTITCGPHYQEVDLYVVPDKKRRGQREAFKQPSSAKQIVANIKKSRRYFIQLVNTNFGWGDYCLHCTYSPANMPKTIEEAERQVTNFMRRIKARRKKLGLPEPTYIIITEYRTKPDGTPTRIHHHILIDGKMDRDEIKKLWKCRHRKGEKIDRPLGTINIDELQPDEYGLEALARYLTKGLTGKKMWHPSKNLKKPQVRKNDYKYSHKKINELAQMTDCAALWQKMYPGYLLTEATAQYTDEAGWHITVKMRRDIYTPLWRKEKYHGKKSQRSNSRPSHRARDAAREN